MGGGDGGDQRVGISVQLWVGFCAAGIIVGERVWGARRGEVGGDEGPILASVAVSAQVPTACVGVDDGL